jgi:hypothetical protein
MCNKLESQFLRCGILEMLKSSRKMNSRSNSCMFRYCSPIVRCSRTCKQSAGRRTWLAHKFSSLFFLDHKQHKNDIYTPWEVWNWLIRDLDTSHTRLYFSWKCKYVAERVEKRTTSLSPLLIKADLNNEMLTCIFFC